MEMETILNINYENDGYQYNLYLKRYKIKE